MRRAGQPEHERRDFYLFIDEFQNFTTDSFEAILAEARKYRLCLTLSHQYVDQIPLPIRQAVFGNVGTLFSFRVGNTKAEVGNHPRLFLKRRVFQEFKSHKLLRSSNLDARVGIGQLLGFQPAPLLHSQLSQSQTYRVTGIRTTCENGLFRAFRQVGNYSITTRQRVQKTHLKMRCWQFCWH